MDPIDRSFTKGFIKPPTGKPLHTQMPSNFPAINPNIKNTLPTSSDPYNYPNPEQYMMLNKNMYSNENQQKIVDHIHKLNAEENWQKNYGEHMYMLNKDPNFSDFSKPTNFNSIEYQETLKKNISK